METAKTLVHAFVTSKLDNCNALLYGRPNYMIQRLQYVLNSTARQVALSSIGSMITYRQYQWSFIGCQLSSAQNLRSCYLHIKWWMVWHLFISRIY